MPSPLGSCIINVLPGYSWGQTLPRVGFGTPKRPSECPQQSSRQARHHLNSLDCFNSKTTWVCLALISSPTSCPYNPWAMTKGNCFLSLSLPPFSGLSLISSITFSFSYAYPLTVKHPNEWMLVFPRILSLAQAYHFSPFVYSKDNLIQCRSFNHSPYAISLSSKSVWDWALHFLY